MISADPQLLSSRWTPLRYHAAQMAWWHSKARFNVIPAGRRSGKTELAKRKLITRAMRGTKFSGARFFAAAPTREQAKRIYWDDLKALTPAWAMVGRPSETELTIQFINGSQVQVLGLDKPERIEGSPWDGGVLDEFGNTKKQAWAMNVRPALSDRNGWCDLIGVPEGRNHYYDIYGKALADTTGQWGAYTWKSADILPPEEIAAARLDLDPLSFAQEYEADFVNFEGRCYYPFNVATHCAPLKYDPLQPLIFTFDFNVAPGTANILQEQIFPNGITGTGCIGEVHIDRNSNTPAVCRKLIEQFGNHQGRVLLYGDATGGSQGTAKLNGSDWDLIQMVLRQKFPKLEMNVARSNPSERARVNAMNTRLLNGADAIHFMIDPAKCPYTVKDFDGTLLLKGGSGEIDKNATPELTHHTDGIGYYVAAKFPIAGKAMNILQVVGT